MTTTDVLGEHLALVAGPAWCTCGWRPTPAEAAAAPMVRRRGLHRAHVAAQLDGDPTAIGMLVDPRSHRMSGHTAHKGLWFDVPFVTPITATLWTGGCEDGLILPAEVQHLVSLYPWEKYDVRHHLRSELTVRMYDSLDENLDQVLDVARWVNSCRADGVTLVHCQAGLNRSALVAATALVIAGSHTPAEAVALLRERRSPAVLCNESFEKWLHDSLRAKADR